MEDQKSTDKRKAPDKTESMEDLSDSSFVQRTPLKRPRLAFDTPEVEIVDLDLIPEVPGHLIGDAISIGDPDDLSLQAGDVVEEQVVEDSSDIVAAIPILINETGLEQGIQLEDHQEMEISLPNLPLENGSNSNKDEDVDGGIEELHVTKADDNIHIEPNIHTEPTSASTFFAEIIDESGLGEVDGSHNAENVISRTGTVGQNDLSAKPLDNGIERRDRTGLSNSQPNMSSSPLSDFDKLVKSPSEVTIAIRAYDGTSNKLVYDEPCIRSTYIDLEKFLNQHKLSLTQSSFNSGYMGDIDTDDNNIFPCPTTAVGRKNRWTSSTLGSSIPRESMKTIFTMSPNDSPSEDPKQNPMDKLTRPRGKNDPMFTSTELSEKSKSDSPPQLDSEVPMPVSNGDTTTNGYETPTTDSKKRRERRSRSSSVKSSAKSGKSSSMKKFSPSGKKSSHSESGSETNTPAPALSTPGSRHKKVKTEKPTPGRTPASAKKISGLKSRAARGSREFAGVIGGKDSPLLHPSVAEPSPARVVAKVEGTVAKPTTTFEQEVNNEPVDIPSLAKSCTLWGNIAANHQVFARWRDKNYYSGFVKEKGLNDTWLIDYDDGMNDVASETHIVPIKILGVGITGVYTPDACYKPSIATVLGQKFVNDPEIGDTVKYAIQLMDKAGSKQEVIWCTRRQLSIKEQDAKALRQEYQPTPKVLKAAEVSLENIILAPRRRNIGGTPTSASVSKSSTSTPQSTKRIVGGAFDESTAAEDSHSELTNTPKRKGLKVLKGKKISKLATASSPLKTTPGTSVKATSSPFKAASSPFKKASSPLKTSSSPLKAATSPLKAISKHSSSSLTTSSSDLGTSLEKSLKESPKKTKLKDGNLFEGYQFFLTASGGADPTSMSSATSIIPYDKDEYRELIESKGGRIVDQVGKERGKDKLYLISDNYARTVKYIYCLAAAVPCVSHKWIQECLNQNVILPWKPHELNAGWSLEENRMILPHKQKPLKGFEIYITAGTDDLYNYWKPVLIAAQAKLLRPKKLKGRNDEDLPQSAQVLVTDATCAKVVLDKAHHKMLPVVKPEWLVQSIIAGKRADFFNHEKYRVEIYEPEELEGDDENDDDDEDDDVEDDVSRENSRS